MANFDFASIRLGKTSVDDIRMLNDCQSGIIEPFKISVTCTQVPLEFKEGVYSFIWLGSDNSKGSATDWKQGYKAFGKVDSINRAENRNDESTFIVEILYIFDDAVSRLDFLKHVPSAYYWCSTMPIIGIDDHSNQTVRMIQTSERSKMNALFYSFGRIDKSFKDDILKIEPGFIDYFVYDLPNPDGTLSSKKDRKNKSFNIKNNQNLIFALKTKPFVLLAGISGTGKSRIVRQLAYATGGENSDKVQKPYNYEMIQVRPNWHDSADLLGYVTRVSGKAEYVMTDFVRFLAKAWYFEGVPFFLCLDEMNLAPVEQYFAEYLSVLETRKLRGNAIISDPIIPALDGLDSKKNGFRVSDPMLDDMFGQEWTKDGKPIEKDQQREDILRLQFRKEGIALPPNLFVVGTVNMDETTYSFSRKVLDRAMTIEMNVVNLRGGLSHESLIPETIDADLIMPDAVEGADVYDEEDQICELTLQYLESVNNSLEGTPFKVAYRTRNEFLVYTVHRVGMSEGSKCGALLRALDEMTFMKILSRIEGDKKKLTDKDGNPLLEKLEEAISKALNKVIEDYIPEEGETKEVPAGQSVQKIAAMKQKLEKSYYCTFWD